MFHGNGSKNRHSFLKLLFITNNPTIAEFADVHGVDRIWVDLETRGKANRQRGLDSVKSHHTMEDISKIRKVLKKAELLVRINSLYEGTKAEVDEAISRGADILMLPMFRSPDDAACFVDLVGGRAKVLLLLETVDAENNVKEIVKVSGIDEIHIGLNDLHLEHHQRFLFELLADGTVDKICAAIRKAGIPYGFGGLAKLDSGVLLGRMVLAEHYRLGSSMVILSRAFFEEKVSSNDTDFMKAFSSDLKAIRTYEAALSRESDAFFEANRKEVVKEVRKIVQGASATKRGF